MKKLLILAAFALTACGPSKSEYERQLSESGVTQQKGYPNELQVQSIEYEGHGYIVFNSTYTHNDLLLFIHQAANAITHQNDGSSLYI